MFAWLKGLFGEAPAESAESSETVETAEAAPGEGPADEISATGQRAMVLQQAYWTPDAAELEALAGRGIAALSWRERLRLNHLLGLAAWESDAGRADLERDLEASDDSRDPARLLGPHADLYRDLLARLMGPDSPYRPRQCMIWEGEPGSTAEPRPPEAAGVLANASLSHLGCLEILRLDAAGEPESVDFIALDDVRGVVFGNPTLFRAARLFLEDDSDAIVFVPLLYGVSWRSPHSHDRDGTMTRFGCHVALDPPSPLSGLGVGHQDVLLVGKEGTSVMGYAAIGEIMVGLEVGDPRFEEKCRGRGLEPEQVRAAIVRKG